MFGIALCEYMLLYMILKLKKLYAFLCTQNKKPLQQIDIEINKID
jgi:hypothetical protein